MRWLAVIVIAALAACSRTVYVPVVSGTHTVENHQREAVRADTLVIRDSVEVTTRADTVYVTRWRDRWHRSVLTDSIHLLRTDTVRVQVPVPVPQPSQTKATSRAEGLRSRLFAPLVLVLVGLVAYIRLRRVKL